MQPAPRDEPLGAKFGRKTIENRPFRDLPDSRLRPKLPQVHHRLAVGGRLPRQAQLNAAAVARERDEDAKECATKSLSAGKSS